MRQLSTWETGRAVSVRGAVRSRLNESDSATSSAYGQAWRSAFLSIVGGYAQPQTVKVTMAKPAPKKAKSVNKAEIEAVELVPDAWPKFEKLVKAAAKTGPQPHVQSRLKKQK